MRIHLKFSGSALIKDTLDLRTVCGCMCAAGLRDIQGTSVGRAVLLCQCPRTRVYTDGCG